MEKSTTISTNTKLSIVNIVTNYNQTVSDQQITRDASSWNRQSIPCLYQIWLAKTAYWFVYQHQTKYTCIILLRTVNIARGIKYSNYWGFCESLVWKVSKLKYHYTVLNTKSVTHLHYVISQISIFHFL